MPRKTRFWLAGAEVRKGPLLRYVNRRFVPIFEYGDYELLFERPLGAVAE